MTSMPRFARFSIDGRTSFGAVTDSGVIDLGPGRTGRWADLDAVIAGGGLGELANLAAARAIDHPLSAITFEIPLTRPEKIICVGVNYPDRNEEYKDGQAAPANPSLFIRFPRSFTGHRQSLIRPPESEQLDYEGEIVVVIGKPGRRISESAALDHVAALTLCNEGTIRDWVRHAKFNVTQGKNFDRSGSIGPWLVPFVSESQIADIAISTKVNGEVRQSDRTSRMIFSFRKIISYISTFTTLAPGDMIVTGTPTGAGARLDPPVWLKPGDEVEVHAEGLGTLTNTIADEVI